MASHPEFRPWPTRRFRIRCVSAFGLLRSHSLVDVLANLTLDVEAQFAVHLPLPTASPQPPVHINSYSAVSITNEMASHRRCQLAFSCTSCWRPALVKL